jgi:hypothetical protein
MDHYEPSIPRFAIGIAAVAMTAITIAVSVIAPAQFGMGGREPSTLAASPMGVATIPGITVVSAREARVSTLSMRIGEAEVQPGRPVKTASPPVVRMSGK